MSQTIAAQDQKLGLELARSFHHALRTSRTHELSNDVAVEALGALTDAFNAIVSRGDGFALHVLGDYLYAGEARLRESGTTYLFLQHVVEEFNSRGIGSLFGRDRVTREGVSELLALFKQFPGGDEHAEGAIRDRLAAHDSVFGIGAVREVPTTIRESSAQVTKREQCRSTFFRAVSVTENLMQTAHVGRRLELRHAKRMVQQMVDLMLDEEFTFLGLTTLRSHDHYTYYHSVNVCIYAIALGRRIGLSNLQLSELGTGALLHDIGKVRIPAEVIQMGEGVSEDEAALMRTHPVLGAKEILKLGGFSPLALQAMVGCFEHHLHFDGSAGGYPVLHDVYQPHIFGRLISIVDCFDALTTKRVYRSQAMRRDRALSYMMSQSGTKFDPLIMRIFTNMIGIYPVGTTVRLQSGRMAVVVEASDDPRRVHRPVVRPISDSSGIEISGITHDAIDLARPRPDGSFADEIAEALDAEALGLDVSRYFA